MFESGRTALAEPLSWKPRLTSLAFLVLFFLVSYNFANWFTSRRAHVPSIAFGWESRVPFLPWTILPYWSSDLLYAASISLCSTRRELDRHTKRLFAAQVISILCFLVFPLRCIFERPETSGIFGWFFHVLLFFDMPFNQAPSLHISLVVIFWSFFSAHLNGLWWIAMRAWLVLVAISTMTTYQHQFIDLPTGVLAGFFVIAVFPDRTNAGRLP